MSDLHFSTTFVTAIILAGGRGQRMGERDKGLLTLAERPLVEHVMDALRPQVGDMIINANRNLDLYQDYGYRVIPDRLEGYAGPLAGIASALEQIATPLALVVPCDSPRPPPDLAQRLYRAMTNDVDIAIAHDGERLQPLFCLLRTTLCETLTHSIAKGHCKVQRWMLERNHRIVDFSDRRAHFDNLNTPEELRKAESTG